MCTDKDYGYTSRFCPTQSGPGNALARYIGTKPQSPELDAVLGKIRSGQVAISPVDEYRSVTEHSPERAEAGIQRRTLAIREVGLSGRKIVVDQYGGILSGYTEWEAVSRLTQEDSTHKQMLDRLRDEADVLFVASRTDGRRLVRLLEIDRIDSAAEASDVNQLIADQIREIQVLIDAHWEEWSQQDPQITGRFRISSSYVARLLKIDNKRVDRVIMRADDLRDLLYLKVMDEHGRIQRGKARPGEGVRRGRRPSSPDDSRYANLPNLGADLGVQRVAGVDRGRPARRDRPEARTAPRSHPLAASVITEERVSKPDEDSAGTHPAVEAVRMAMLDRSGDQGDSTWPLPVAPAWSPPTIPFNPVMDEMPPDDPSLALAGGGIGIAHLYSVARLLARKGTGHTPPGWSKDLDDYADRVLTMFEAWLDSWNEKTGQWSGRSEGRKIGGGQG